MQQQFFEGKSVYAIMILICNHLLLDSNNRLTGILIFEIHRIIDEYCDFIYLLEDSEEEIGTNFGEDILNVWKYMILRKQKEYQRYS